VLDLFKAFVDIALWRKGPQHLPTSMLLLVMVVLLDTILTLAFRRALNTEKELLLRVVLEVGLSLGWIWLLLALFSRAERFAQTTTAIFGTSVLLTPLMYGMEAMLDGVGKTGMLAVPLRLVLLTVFVWYLLINANIVRAALEVNLFIAVVLTVLGTWCVYVVAERIVALATQVT
jgi:hypothetical protein